MQTRVVIHQTTDTSEYSHWTPRIVSPYIESSIDERFMALCEEYYRAVF